MVRDLQKEVYYLMEREVILGITKVSLNVSACTGFHLGISHWRGSSWNVRP